jgi:hypothetical protein
MPPQTRQSSTPSSASSPCDPPAARAAVPPPSTTSPPSRRHNRPTAPLNSYEQAGLSQTIQQALLADIVKAGGFNSSTCTVPELCRRNPYTYGKVFLRSQVKSQFHRWKKLPPESWSKLLLDFGFLPRSDGPSLPPATLQATPSPPPTAKQLHFSPPTTTRSSAKKKPISAKKMSAKKTPRGHPMQRAYDEGKYSKSAVFCLRMKKDSFLSPLTFLCSSSKLSSLLMLSILKTT